MTPRHRHGHDMCNAGGVKIHRLQIKPVAHRFMLGDNSEVWIKW